MPDPPVPEGARLPVDPLAAELGERFRAAGHELFLVGGVVRARFLGETGPELDFATDATPKETLEVLRGWADRHYLQGVQFGTVGARKRDVVNRFPVYGVPDDLITVDLASLVPELRGLRLRGRLEGKRLVPYYSRGEIDERTCCGGGTNLRAPVLAWIADPVELFFLQIQGSGQVELPDGNRLRLGFADQNGVAGDPSAWALLGLVALAFACTATAAVMLSPHSTPLVAYVLTMAPLICFTVIGAETISRLLPAWF